jgi:DNA-binding CsgD family transcriptional regulator/PAS domain-containing protein
MRRLGESQMNPQDLSDTIGAIYDCALEPERWPQTLARLETLSRSGFSFIVLHDLIRNMPGRVFEHGGSEEWLQLYFTKYATLNPIPAASSLRPLGEVHTLSMLFEDEEWLGCRFYKEWMEPQGLGDMLGIVVLRSGNRAGWLVTQKKNDTSKFSEAQLDAFRLLSPHICRAIKISDALDLRTMTSESLEATVDVLSAGVFLLDSQGRVVYANRTGDRQVRTGNALRIVNNRLSPIDRSASAALVTALSSATGGSVSGNSGAHSIAFPASDGEGLIATVMPVDQGQRRSLMAPWAAKVAVFVQNPAVAPQMPGEAFAKLYGLTGGELRVALAMAPGLGAKEAAEVLGLSEATVRTHQQHLFQKTGTSKQAELVRLLMAATPPVRQL